MSIVNPASTHVSSDSFTPPPQSGSDQTAVEECFALDRVIASVEKRLAPVWRLQDFVAVNPYLGYTGEKFLDARRQLQSVSDIDTLVSLDYYRDAFRLGTIQIRDIDEAIDELRSDPTRDRVQQFSDRCGLRVELSLDRSRPEVE